MNLIPKTTSAPSLCTSIASTRLLNYSLSEIAILLRGKLVIVKRLLFGSGAHFGDMLLVKIIENNKIDSKFRLAKVKVSFAQQS